MRTRRFRPCVDFRPGFDLLLPRITPSDISLFVYTNPVPVPDSVVVDPTVTDATPPTTPPNNTSTTNPDGSSSSPYPSPPALGC